MKKLAFASLPLLLLLCSGVVHAQDLDPRIAGLRLKDMTIYLSVAYHGPYSYTRRVGPAQEIIHSEGIGTILHKSEIHGEDARWQRNGDIFTARYSGDSLHFIYDSVSSRLTAFDYTYESYNSMCYGGTSARISMSSVPVTVVEGQGIRDNWNTNSDWRNVVTSWSYHQDEDCPVPYHNSYTGYAHADSLEGPVKLTFATASMDVHAKSVRAPLQYRITSSGLTLEFYEADQARELLISDILGKEILRATIPPHMNAIELPSRDIPGGMLLLRLGNETLKISL